MTKPLSMIEGLDPIVAASLQPLFDRAEQARLWFNSHYHQLWFSPEELYQELVDGKFRWDASNWRLRSPVDHLKELEIQRKAAEDEAKRFAVRMI